MVDISSISRLILLPNCCPSIRCFFGFHNGHFSCLFLREFMPITYMMMGEIIHSLHAGDIVTSSLIICNIFYYTLYDLSFPNVQGFSFCHIEVIGKIIPYR